MNAKKIYIAIAVVFGIAYATNLYWLFRLLTNIGEYSYFRFSYLIRYIPVFAGITGLVIFLQSKFKRSNLLRVMMCLEIVSFPFVAVWYLLYFTQEARYLNQKLPVNWQLYFGLALNASLFISSIIGLRMLSLNKTARLTYIDYGGDRTAQFSPAKAEVRFANRSIDALLIIYVLLINLGSYSTFIGYAKDVFQPEYIFLLEIPFLLLYYLILEGIFNTTAGKCATGTTITNADGGRPGFGQIVLRTFCRLIPFEAFSFFTAGARGWHDTFSNTYVVPAINKEDAFMDEIIFDAELENPPL
jgi:uncharacterized RDD family membrane protein YckC